MYSYIITLFCIQLQLGESIMGKWIKRITASSIMDDPNSFTEFMGKCYDVEHGANIQVKII